MQNKELKDIQDIKEQISIKEDVLNTNEKDLTNECIKDIKEQIFSKEDVLNTKYVINKEGVINEEDALNEEGVINEEDVLNNDEKEKELTKKCIKYSNTNVKIIDNLDKNLNYDDMSNEVNWLSDLTFDNTLTQEEVKNKYKNSDSKIYKAALLFFIVFTNLKEKILLSSDDEKILISYDKTMFISMKISEQIMKLENGKDFPKIVRNKLNAMKKNYKLAFKLYNAKISPTDLLNLTADQLKSEELKEEENKIIENSINESKKPKLEAESDMFVCGKCKSRKTTWFQRQMRSCDEPMTTVVTCLKCKNTWRFS